MTIRIEAGPADRHVIALMDEVFLTSKGRTGSVAARFPNVFGQGANTRFIVARDREAVAGALAIRKFKWIVGAETFSGAMIGFVCTAQMARGRGIGSRLMARAAEEMRAQHADFGVLWTAAHGFYSRLGWTLSDAATFGPLAGRSPAEPESAAIFNHGLEFSKIEQARTEYEPMRVARATMDYSVTPLPAATVECWSPTKEIGDAYALIGRHGSSAYIYEVVGEVGHFAQMSRSLGAIAQTVYLNSHPRSPFGNWALSELGYAGNRQNQAMWLPISSTLTHARFDEWYVPFFDRI
jgi:predicted N-acetyltransferase YhbS